MRLMFTVLFWLLCGVAVAEQPGDFAFGMPIEVSGTQALFEVELPAAVHEGVMRADLGDLQVFNAAGEPVPHAFLPRLRASREKGKPLSLPFFALRGDAVGGVEGVEVRVERGTGKTVLTMRPGDGKPLRPAALLGYVVDASLVESPLQALVLELPAGADNVVTRLRVEASDDLARWTTLVADAPVVYLAAGGQRLEQLRVEFPPRQARYFRLSWPAAARPLELRGLTLEPGEAVVEAPRRWRQVPGSAATDKDARAGDYVFDLGGQFPVDRLRISLPQINSVAAIEILARAGAGDAWRRVAVSTAYRLGAPGEEVVSPDLPVSLTTDRYWLLRVDQRGGGLGAGTLELGVGWLPQRLVFAARGAAPFQLAYGSRRAGPVAYPASTLVPGYRADDDGAPAAVPLGRATTGAVLTLAGDSALREPVDWQRWTLWGSLLLGVVLLGWMALRLGRQLSGARSEPPGNGPGAA